LQKRDAHTIPLISFPHDMNINRDFYHRKLVRTLRKKAMINKNTSGYYREECNNIASFYDIAVKFICLPFGGEKKFRKDC
jgi:hypothetical protein